MSITVSLAPTPAAPAGRCPTPVRLAAGVMGLLALLQSYGAYYFSFVFEQPEVRATSVVFVALVWALNATALAAAVGLVRGRRLARRIALGYVGWHVAFTAAKLVFWHETEAVGFGVVSLALLGLLCTPASRRYAR
jgi:hypothetical protein